MAPQRARAADRWDLGSHRRCSGGVGASGARRKGSAGRQRGEATPSQCQHGARKRRPSRLRPLLRLALRRCARPAAWRRVARGAHSQQRACGSRPARQRGDRTTSNEVAGIAPAAAGAHRRSSRRAAPCSRHGATPGGGGCLGRREISKKWLCQHVFCQPLRRALRMRFEPHTCAGRPPGLVATRSRGVAMQTLAAGLLRPRIRSRLRRLRCASQRRCLRRCHRKLVGLGRRRLCYTWSVYSSCSQVGHSNLATLAHCSVCHVHITSCIHRCLINWKRLNRLAMPLSMQPLSPASAERPVIQALRSCSA